MSSGRIHYSQQPMPPFCVHSLPQLAANRKRGAMSRGSEHNGLARSKHARKQTRPLLTYAKLWTQL